MPDATERARWLATTAGTYAPEDAVLRITGDDARSWLAGQVTNDTRGMSEGDAVYSLILDGRGKILADAWLLERGVDVLLVVPRDTASDLLTHFDKYIVMEDVELAATDQAVLTVQGPRAAEVLERAGLGAGFSCDRLGFGGRDLVVDASAKASAHAALTAAAEALGGGEVDAPSWELARLRAGRPRFGVDFGPANYPQEAGLETLAVSFDKGCYLGQEVVCILDSRGQLSKHLVHLELDGAPPPSGLELRLDDRVVGQVTSAVLDPEATRLLALGYVKRAAAAEGTTLTSERGPVRVRGRVNARAAGQQEARAL